MFSKKHQSKKHLSRAGLYRKILDLVASDPTRKKKVNADQTPMTVATEKSAAIGSLQALCTILGVGRRKKLGEFP